MRAMGGKLCAGVVIVMLGASAAPARPGGRPAPVPVQISDVSGDANYTASQYGLDPLGVYPEDARDVQTAADASDVADLLDVWFSNDAATISVHVHTEAPPPGPVGFIYRVLAYRTDLGGIFTYCMWFTAHVPGEAAGNRTTYQDEPSADVYDSCGALPTEPGDVKTVALSDGTGVTTMTFPRSYSPLLATGSKLTEPYAEVRHLQGNYDYKLLAPAIDDTRRGKTYVVTRG